MEASELYEKAYTKDTTRTDLALRVGESYYFINEHHLAEPWYELGINESDTIDPHVWMRYAQCLIVNKKYDQAKHWLQKYNSHIEEDQHALNKISTLDDIHFHFRDSASVEIHPLNINTEHIEFSPAYYGDGIVFLSDQHRQEINNVMDWNAEEFVDMYYTEEREDGSMKEPTEFHNTLKSKYHEGPLVFFDENKIMFTRTGVRNKHTKHSHLELYQAEYDHKKDKWINIEPLPFNSDDYSVGHPAITKSGDTLIFASNMPGGYGGTDLYISYNTNDQWSEPENLGPIINSKGNEVFPYFPNHDEIVFASNGHGGLGDLDLFRTNLADHSHETIENLGYPYNSPKADFGYISDEYGTNGYFTSNRINGGLDDDLFRFTVKWSKIEGLLVNKKNSPVKNIRVDMITNGQIKDTKYSDSLGIVELIVLPGEEVILEASAKGYFPATKLISIEQGDAGKLFQFTLEMREIPKPKRKKKPKDSYTQLKELYNKKKAMIQVNGRIFEYREIGNYQFLVNADEKILLSKDPPDDELTIEQRAEKAVESKGMKMDGSYFIKNIYFDVNSVALSDSAKIELDKVVKIMTVDQNIAFEIISFTDSRGSMSYNDELAFKRSQNIARYLLEKDISGSRLILDSYGEQGLLNNCDDNQECDDLYHAVNRRAEFKLLMRKIHN